MNNILTDGTFPSIVREMSAHDIIMTLVTSLRNPKLERAMESFGEVKDGICYGCGATECILEISKVAVVDFAQILEHTCDDGLGTSTMIPETDFLSEFENAIDFLRMGNVDLYNILATNGGFARIEKQIELPLPYLGNNYRESQLKVYEQLAKAQLEN